MRRRAVIVSVGGVAALLALAGGTALLVGGAGEGGSGGVGNKPAAQPPAGPSARGDVTLPPDTAIVQKAAFTIRLQCTGELFSQQQVELRNDLGMDAKILELHTEGARVPAGTVVAKLSAEELEKQIKDEQLAVETATSELVSAETAVLVQISENDSTLRKAQVTLEQARLDLRKWNEGEVPSRRQKIDTEVDEAQIELERTADKLTQAKGLRERGFISTDEYKAAELAARKARSQAETARLSKLMFEQFEMPKEQATKEAAFADAESELQRTQLRGKSQLESKQSEVSTRGKQKALREAQLKKLTDALGKATLVAPSEGLVVYSSTIQRWITDDNLPWRVGKTIHPGQPLIIMPETASLVAKVRIPETKSNSVKIGQPATIKVDARGGVPLAGEVLSVGLLAEHDYREDAKIFSIMVKLPADAAKLDLRPSMRCDAEILLERVPEVTTVPVTTVFAEGPMRYVLVESGRGQYARVPVKIGRRSERLAEILAGVEPGTRILAREPRADEVLPGPIPDALLAKCDLKRDEQGNIVAAEPPAEAKRDTAAGTPAPAAAPAPSSATPAASSPTSPAPAAANATPTQSGTQAASPSQ